MGKTILGIHHVTAIAGDPQRNLDFYTGVLGLRLVKLTVNYDDPETYHFYFGDAEGRPGSILTFFPWPGAPKGRHGAGQLTVTSFSVPDGSLGYWIERLRSHGVEVAGPAQRFDEEYISFADPGGLQLELAARAGAGAEGHALRGFHGVTLSEEGYERTASLLTQTMGLRTVAADGNRFRYQAGSQFVDLLCVPDSAPGRVAVGTVHHVAWRTATDEEQKDWREDIARLGYNLTPIVDRKYFHSVYFREPGGVLFEIATDPPGFTVDEPLEQLGSKLVLPPWLEPARAALERRLPPVRLPERTRGAH